jgi:hypothetical protein
MEKKNIIKCLLIVATVVCAYLYWDANQTWFGHVIMPIGDAVTGTVYLCIVGVIIFLENAILS